MILNYRTIEESCCPLITHFDYRVGLYAVLATRHYSPQITVTSLHYMFYAKIYGLTPKIAAKVFF